jgi:exodeoxyribonuclease VII large subunit
MNRLLFDPDEPEGPAEPPARRVWSVTELNAQLRETVQQEFSSIWVSGEVTDIARPSSGHVYLTLKDEQSLLRAVLWRSTAARLRFELKDGIEILCEGQLDIYAPRGTYQLIVRQVEPQGMGALQLAFQQLHARLEAEGLFDPRRKRPLPRFPQRIGVVTSPTGAAVRDFCEVQRRRWPSLDVLILPTRVQGDEAVPEIVQAIRAAQQIRPRLDCVVVTRGGGSLEDLWCFNDERVVREVAACSIPLVSAIGHEIDVTLTDLAADVRALTPTEAAERITPSREEMLGELSTWQRRLGNSMDRRLQFARLRLESLGQRPVLARPEQRLTDLARRLDELEARMERAAKRRVESLRQDLRGFAGQLEALSPLGVLARGYSLTQRPSTGECLRSFREVQPGDQLLTYLAEGRVVSQVVSTENDAARNDATDHSHH